MSAVAESQTSPPVVGDVVHNIQQGECVDSIAFRYGVTAQMIWDDEKNAELRKAREQRDVLLPGDKVFIPIVRAKVEAVTTSKTTVFIAKRALRNVRLRLVKDAQTPPPPAKLQNPNEFHNEPPPVATPEAWANVDAQLVGEGFTWKGTTDEDGKLRAEVPMACSSALLIVAGGTEEEKQFELQFGRLDPLDTPSGVAHRLSNLGYAAPAATAFTPQITDALKAFQRARGLPISGEMDVDTRAALQQ